MLNQIYKAKKIIAPLLVAGNVAACASTGPRSAPAQSQMRGIDIAAMQSFEEGIVHAVYSPKQICNFANTLNKAGLTNAGTINSVASKFNIIGYLNHKTYAPLTQSLMEIVSNIDVKGALTAAAAGKLDNHDLLKKIASPAASGVLAIALRGAAESNIFTSAISGIFGIAGNQNDAQQAITIATNLLGLSGYGVMNVKLAGQYPAQILTDLHSNKSFVNDFGVKIDHNLGGEVAPKSVADIYYKEVEIYQEMLKQEVAANYDPTIANLTFAELANNCKQTAPTIEAAITDEQRAQLIADASKYYGKLALNSGEYGPVAPVVEYNEITR